MKNTPYFSGMIGSADDVRSADRALAAQRTQAAINAAGLRAEYAAAQREHAEVLARHNAAKDAAATKAERNEIERLKVAELTLITQRISDICTRARELVNHAR